MWTVTPCRANPEIHRSGKMITPASTCRHLIGSLGADWNDSHVFNRAWTLHARFRAVVYLCMMTYFSAMGLVLVWRDSADHGVELAVAALVPVISWGSFYLAALVPGVGIEDDPGSLRRIAGVPMNLFFAGVFSVISLFGLLLYSLG
jgi:hypothetical protein